MTWALFAIECGHIPCVSGIRPCHNVQPGHSLCPCDEKAMLAAGKKLDEAPIPTENRMMWPEDAQT